MKKSIPYILLVALIASIALNIRLIIIFEELQEDYWVEYFKALQKDDEVLYYIENDDLQKAKDILSESIKNKGMLFFIFTEENSLSENALEEIQANKFVPDKK